MVTVRELRTDLNVKGNAQKRFKLFNLNLVDLKVGLDAAVAGVKAVASGIRSLTTDVIAQGAELSAWSQKIGISARDLQELQFAGKAVGADIDKSREAIKTFRENLGEMQRLGTGPAVDSLATLGIALEDIIDLSATEQVSVLSDAFVALENDAQRLSVATEVMGDDGAALLPLFKRGAKGVKILTDEFKRLGLGLSDAQVALAADLGQSIRVVEAQVESIRLQISAELIPVIKEVVDAAGEWINTNKRLIKTKLQDFIKKLITEGRALLPTLRQMLEQFSGLLFCEFEFDMVPAEFGA